MNTPLNYKKTTLTLIFALFLIFIEQAKAENKIIKIVSSLPRTGSSNAQTTTIVNGIKLAIEEQGSTINGYTIKYEDWDDASPERGSWDPSVEAANAEKAVTDESVLAYIGPYNSGAAKISMPILNKANLPMITPSASWPGLTKPKVGEPNEPMSYRPTGKVTFFRINPADDIQGKVGGNWIKSIGAKSLYIVHDREVYGKGLANILKKTAESHNIEILGFDGVDPKASNYKSLATKIKQKNPDIVFFGGITQTNAGQFAKDLVNSGAKSKMLFGDGCFEQAFIDAAGAEVINNRAFFTFGGLPPAKLTGKGEDFYKKYKSKFNAEPEAYSVYGYEAANVVIQSIKKLKIISRKDLVDILANTKNYDGALGVWSFDENGDSTITKMSLNTVKNGKFEFVQTLE